LKEKKSEGGSQGGGKRDKLKGNGIKMEKSNMLLCFFAGRRFRGGWPKTKKGDSSGGVQISSSLNPETDSALASSLKRPRTTGGIPRKSRKSATVQGKNRENRE